MVQNTINALYILNLRMSARPFGCNLIRRPNAGGRTLLENWVEERATKQFDETSDRQSILRNGHNNIVSTRF